MAEGSLLGTETPTAEEIATQEAEDKQLLETEDEDLSPEDKEKKTTLLTAQNEKEEKRLLDADDKDLSAEDKDKKTALVKAKADAKVKADAKAKEDAKKKGDKAPEKYADFTIPEGAEVNQPRLDEFKTLAKEYNLSQEKAQGLIDLQAKLEEDNADKLLEAYEKTKEGWMKESIKELGADYKKELVFAEKTIAKFGTSDLRKVLNDTGLGNHKELVNFFVKVGKTISEDTFVEGEQKGKLKTDAELFYPNMNK